MRRRKDGVAAAAAAATHTGFKVSSIPFYIFRSFF
jgi:hypothetical protein